MAEKEERIRIEQFTPAEFGHCNGFTTDGDGYYCEWAGESIPITKEICEKKCPYDSSISRQEAIERMAKALSEIRCANYTHFMKDAEAALNALLEE